MAAVDAEVGLERALDEVALVHRGAPPEVLHGHGRRRREVGFFDEVDEVAFGRFFYFPFRFEGLPVPDSEKKGWATNCDVLPGQDTLCEKKGLGWADYAPMPARRGAEAQLRVVLIFLQFYLFKKITFDSLKNIYSSLDPRDRTCSSEIIRLGRRHRSWLRGVYPPIA